MDSRFTKPTRKEVARRFAVLLYPLLALLFVSPLAAKSLQDLDKDADKFVAELTEKAVKPAQGSAYGDSIDQLLGAASTMEKAKDCKVATSLRLQALRMGGEASANEWRTLAKSAYCARNWELASRANWLALQRGLARKQQAQTWADLGNALKSRSNYRHDWKPAALGAFERVLEFSKPKWVLDVVAELREAIATQASLHVDSTRVDSSDPQPALCVSFNDNLDDHDEATIGDYFRVEPKFDAVYQVNWSEVCLLGAAWSTSYKVTVLSGLQASDRRLLEHKEMEIETGERPPALWFDGSAYVLSASDSLDVPLHVINTPKAEVRLLRIHERNILSDWVQDEFRNELTERELRDIELRIGEAVWEGAVEAAGPTNQDHQAWISLPESVQQRPGLYVLVAKDSRIEPGNWDMQATQWLVVTDIGLTTYQGEHGLTLVARRLRDAMPLSGVSLTLMARNNEPLAEVYSDERGIAHFAPGLLRGLGGKAPTQITAHGQGLGFTFLQLRQPAFDLSDRGVDGRTAPGPLDAFLYAERGVYRPGETVNLTGLLRDQQGNSMARLPLTLKLMNSAGNLVRQRVLQPGESGAYLTSLHIGAGAPTGSWTASLHTDPDSAAIGSLSFLVEQIMPPRMEAELQVAGVLQVGKPAEAQLAARYLFGAPAGERPVRSELTIETDPAPFPQYIDYTFGRDGETAESDWIELPETVTDAEGKAQLVPLLETMPTHRQPLRARLRAEVLDVDGRTIGVSASLPVRHLPIYLGLDPQFESGGAAITDSLQVNLLALDGAGAAVSRSGVQWRLVSEQWDYQWFRKNGQWAYERMLREYPAGEGLTEISGDGNTSVALKVPGRGDYRLEIQDGETGILSSLRFRVGEHLIGSHDTPDAVKVVQDKPGYLPGDVAVLELDSPFDGPASLVIAGEKIHSIQTLEPVKGKARVEIPVAHDWGAGAYALVTVYRPGESAVRGAGRAIGVAWLGVKPQRQTLSLSLEMPEVVRPRGNIELPIQIDGRSLDESVYLTLAAVDEGVLDLTHYATPDPLGHFFGKRRLGVSVRDLYGRLIAKRGQRPDHLRSGAGTSGRRGMPPSNVKIVSLFSGEVRADREGIARVPLELPDFNGRLRLMAVAWSRDKLGSMEQDLIVRDPVVASPSLPRFLAVGDQGEVNLLLNNLDGPAGDYRLTARASGPVSLSGDEEYPVSLDKGGKETLRIGITANNPGKGHLELVLSGPEGYSWSKRLEMGVRGRFLPLVEREFITLQAGQSFKLDQSLLGDLYPQGARITLQASSAPALDVPGLLAELRSYPHGCLEQLTSRGFPLLLANDLAERWGTPIIPERKLQVERIIRGLIDKQHGSGAFGLWSGRDDEELWLTSYALELLIQAREQGLEVADYFINRALDRLEQVAGNNWAEGNDDLAERAYAHYLLSIAGRAQGEELRYLYDNQLDEMPSALALAQLGAALSMQGDEKRAEGAFQQALLRLDRKPLWSDYGSRVRDMAGVILVAANYGQGLIDTARLWHELVMRVEKKRWLSTQEKAWLLRAANTLEAPDDLSIKFARQKLDSVQAWSTEVDVNELAQGQTLENLGKKPVYLIRTREGTPRQEPQRSDEGFSIRREWVDLEGNPVDPANLRQGDLLVAIIAGEVNTKDNHRALVMDLLPAGFEIENPSLADSRSTQDFEWLPELTYTRHVEALDDRFVAAFDLEPPQGNRKTELFILSYLVRVVTPGQFAVPPPEIEDMYRPRFRASGVARDLTVQPR